MAGSSIRTMFGAFRRYVAHPDPLTAALNSVAMVLAGNTPFYPVYLWFVLGRAAEPSILLTLLSLPFWAAIPAISRRNALAGRMTLAIVGTFNTMWCSWLLGFQSGEALFLIPCIMLATLGFHRSERWIMIPLACLPFLAYALDRLAPMAPFTLYSASDYGRLVILNGFSVACLTFFLGFAFAGSRPSVQT